MKNIAPGISLKMRATPLTNKEKLLNYIGCSLSAVLLFLGFGGVICSTLNVSVNLLVLIMVGVPVCMLTTAMAGIKKLRVAGPAGLLLLIAVFCRIFSADVRIGFGLLLNRIIDVLTKSTGRIFLGYQAAGYETEYMFGAIMFALAASALLAMLSAYFAYMAKLFLPLMLFLCIWAVSVMFGIVQSDGWMVVLTFAFVLQMCRYATNSNTVPDEGRTMTYVFILLLTISCVITFATMVLSSGKTVNFGGLNKSITRLVHNIRYEKAKSIMPEGRLNGLGSLKMNSDVMLTVTMSNPAPLYLRGYIGEIYTGKDWEELPTEKLCDSSDMFYWMHKNGFYGQTQLARLALLVGNDIPDEPANMTVRNEAACSQYIYAPYEFLNKGVSNLLDSNMIGDARIIGSGLVGQREYSYSLLNNQVQNANTLVMALEKAQDGSNPEIEEYLANESAYREFVYSNYMEMTKEINDIFIEYLGEKPEGKLSYQDAKVNIIAFLTKNIAYDESAVTAAKNTDFVRYVFETGRGYSVHFATAASMMFRYYGIPSRYVEGYLVKPETITGAEGGTAIKVDGYSAHTWTEIYQDGVGWIPVEVTPPYISIMPQPDWSFASPGNSGVKPDIPDKEILAPEPEAENIFAFDFKWLIIAGILILIVGLTVFVIRIVMRRKAFLRLLASFKVEDNSDAICNMFGFTVRILNLMGFEHQNISIFERKRAADEWLGEDGAEKLMQIAAINHEAMFSNHLMEDRQRNDTRNFMKDIIAKYENGLNPFKRFYMKWIRGVYQ